MKDGKFKKGGTPWNKGLKYNKELKSRLDLSGLWTNGERKGSKQSAETIKKISDAKKKNPTKYWLGKKRSDMTKENHFNWKGGISSEDRLERVKFSQTLRKKVLERDEFTCQICGKVGGQLQVDHIKSWAENPELRFELSNCRTLCQKCHYKLTFNRAMPEKIKTWGHNLTLN